jgi:hypothetical protein
LVVSSAYKNGTDGGTSGSCRMDAKIEANQERMIAKLDSYQEKVDAWLEEA